jgi:hypothetical protein
LSPPGEIAGLLYTDPGKGSWPVAVRDISPLGVALVGRVEAKPGRMVTVQLYRKGQNDWSTVPARVISSAALPTGDHLLGLVFLVPLSPEELTSFG